MKKALLIILTISILGFLGYWGVEMSQFAEGVKQDAQRMEKFKEQHPSGELKINKESIESKDLKEILLTETKLGNTNLNGLDGTNIKQNLKSGFPAFKIKKEIGQQDGPDFKLYQVEYMNEEIFFISMDSYNSMLVQDIWTKNPKIKDEYGLFVGVSIDSALANRPDLNFHSDLHYNIYASAKNSKIQYRLNGEFKSLNDSSFVAEDYSVEKWQIEGMKIEYLIWKR
jgi:hypothetical protein